LRKKYRTCLQTLQEKTTTKETNKNKTKLLFGILALLNW